MKIELTVDQGDAIVVSELLRQLEYWEREIQNYEQGLDWVHEDDYKIFKKLRKSAKAILGWYGEG